MSYITAPGYKIMIGGVEVDKITDAKAKNVIGVILNHFKITFETLVKKCRKRDIAYAREVCMWMLRKHTALSLSEIGTLLGGKDHTTVIHARDRINDLLEAYPEVSDELKIIEEKL